MLIIRLNSCISLISALLVTGTHLCQCIHRSERPNIFNYPYDHSDRNYFENYSLLPRRNLHKPPTRHDLQSLRSPGSAHNTQERKHRYDKILHQDIQYDNVGKDLNSKKPLHSPEHDREVVNDQYIKEKYDRRIAPSKSSIPKFATTNSFIYPILAFLRTALTTIFGLLINPSMLTLLMGVGSAASVATQGFAGLFNILWILSFTVFAFGKFLVKATFRLSTVLSNFVTQFIGVYSGLNISFILTNLFFRLDISLV